MTAGYAPVAFVLKGYPRLSETFIAQEIHALEQRGLDLRLYSLRHPTDTKRHPVHDEIRAPVDYLPEYLYQEPLTVLRAWLKVRRLPGYRTALRRFLADWWRDRTPNRGRRFGQALVLAARLPAEIRHIHAHFLHTPASVARYAALMTGRNWSVSAHAKDIWTSPDWEKREKLVEMAWGVTCTASGHAHLNALAPTPDTVSLVYHGLDFSRFPEPVEQVQANGPVMLLSVGRLVEKKGYDDLLAALALLPPDLDWRFVHAGGGDRARLEAQAGRLGIADHVRWLGSRAQDELLPLYREAQVFVLASRIAASGDRDGLPNVLMEAQSQALACLSTAVSAIPELIEDGVTGLLVPPSDPPALAAALARLIGDAGLRAVLGRAGFERVRARFTHQAGIDRLVALLCASPSTRP